MDEPTTRVPARSRRPRWTLIAVAAATAAALTTGPQSAAEPFVTTPFPDQDRLPAPALDRTGWRATASSEDGAGRADGVLDPAGGRHWTSGADQRGERWIAIALPTPRTVSALVYHPLRGAQAQLFLDYRIDVRTPERDWFPVSSGRLGHTEEAKTIAFPATTASAVRLVATDTAAPRQVSAARLDLLGDPGHRPGSVPLPRTGWTATGRNGAQSAAAVLDDDPRTFWSGRRTASGAPSITLDLGRPQRVDGLVYAPPRDRSKRVLGYAVSTSSDGAQFTEVARGTWSDDDYPKTAVFDRVTQARHVRLTAQQGPEEVEAAEITLDGPATPATHGAWSTRTIGLPLVPAAAAVLPDGTLLTWSSGKRTAISTDSPTHTARLRPDSGVVEPEKQAEVSHEMFCPGTAALADGRLLVTGGDSITSTSSYDPATGRWSREAGMAAPRGYPGMTLLSTGEAFVLGGSWNSHGAGRDGDHPGEVFSPATGRWRTLPGVLGSTIHTADEGGPYRADNHGWFHAVRGGRVFHAGPGNTMHWIDTAGSGTATSAGTRGTQDAMHGNAASYDVGKIFTAGGAPHYRPLENEIADPRYLASNRARLIDLTGAGGPRVTDGGAMRFRRAYATSVVLPDGKVLVIGGQRVPLEFTDTDAVLTPELWNPADNSFTPQATMAVPRNYHSVATLLPDGRVFSGGGGLCGQLPCETNHPDGQVFSPPYLFDRDGREAPRPTIHTAPATATAGGQLTVEADDGVSFVLVRYGPVTHTVNNDQRRIPLRTVSTSPATRTRYTVEIPPAGDVLPGNHMLFALKNGVPSVAKIVNVGL
ncbi:galactose oxidase [Saccharothrix coeruleofusca]|uniref:discoidin domain-containing protein n=1 Tax=Saccharothrix coeruleofusca TaxID=33919 RepID=UPI001AE3A658|nr:discoidin domain-containing protein [Saccharothrix coeruleofusca]MBP2337542.1 galactose oxidase [Saccharothrix coeruleofusca]